MPEHGFGAKIPLSRHLAVQYAELGWPVFPIVPGGKEPLTDHGHLDASTDPATIAAWWSCWPAANVATPTGVAFDVLDVDTPEGRRVLRELVPEGLPCGPVVRTGGGGRHYLFAPSGRRSRTRFLPGLDVKAGRGYVLLVGSVTSRPYRWLRPPGETLPEFPAVLLDLLPPDLEHDDGRDPPGDLGRGPTTRYGRVALEREAADVEGVPEGGRNGRLNLAAFRIGQLALEGEVNLLEARDRLAQAGLEAGLEQRETRATVDSGLRGGLRNSRVRARGYSDSWHSGPLGSSAGIAGGQPGGGGPRGATGPGVRTRRLSTVEPESVEWFWTARIPVGKLTLIVGDPGVGKSYLYLALTALATRGQPLPLTPAADPVSVAIFNAEDGAEDTLRPRADLLDVDVERVLLLEEFTSDGKRAPFGPEHVPALEAALASLEQCRLLVVDPVASLIGGTVDTYRDNEVRAALDPLVALARRRRMAVVGVLHMNKATALKALYRASGSVGFVGLARSVLLAAREEETGRSAVDCIKHNLCGPSTPLEYRIGDVGFVWVGPAPELTADRLLAEPIDPEDRTAREEAENFLRDQLQRGDRRSKDVDVAARGRGIALRTLRRARKALGVVAEQRPTGDNSASEWWLSIPGDFRLRWPE